MDMADKISEVVTYHFFSAFDCLAVFQEALVTGSFIKIAPCNYKVQWVFFILLLFFSNNWFFYVEQVTHDIVQEELWNQAREIIVNEKSESAVKINECSVRYRPSCHYWYRIISNRRNHFFHYKTPHRLRMFPLSF
ncbi:hypothetical protein BDA99DRAFT_529623 [Phascolomyces articulosus]|uniref:Uncharacterized protein n=1 Tax=Phascolomyces articulosus TaxID=60185 RepID=A0AAD5JKM6_9FUNG|nr:hypothetical protein BDA99DRAFT_529623 [Phascolomyces articulosus]